MRLVVAPVRVGHERLGAVRGPLDRPADLPGRPQHRGLLLVDEDLRPEPAAHVGCDDVQLVLRRDLDEGGEHQAVDVRVLAREPQRVVAGGGVVVADGGPRLHRVGDEAVVDEIETGHVMRAGKRLVDGRAVSDLPVVAEVAGGFGVNLRSSFGERVAHGHRRRKRGVAHLHPFRRVARRLRALRHHDGHRVSDVAHRVGREDGMGRRLVGLAVLAGDHPAADERADPVAGHVRPGQDRHHAGRGGRGRRVQGEGGVRVHRAHECGVRLVRQVRVVGVVAGTGEEPVILGAGDRCPNSVLSHVSHLRALRLRRPGSTSRCCGSRCIDRDSPPATRGPRRRSDPGCGPPDRARS